MLEPKVGERVPGLLRFPPGLLGTWADRVAWEQSSKYHNMPIKEKNVFESSFEPC